MKNLNLVYGLLFFAALSTLMSSCQAELFGCIRGEGNEETKELVFEEFTGFEVFGSSDVTLVQGATQKVEITSFPNLTDLLEEESYVQDGILFIGIDQCVAGIGNQVKIKITVPFIEEVRVEGSGDIKTSGVFENIDNLLLDIEGSGDMNMNLGTDMSTVSVRIEGSGDVALTGSTDIFNINIDGSGDISAFALNSNVCSINISGSGDCQVNVADELNVRIAGSGDVCYRGSPVVDSDISGNGDVSDCN